MSTYLHDPTFPSSVVEPRLDHLIRAGIANPIFLQGAFPFVGSGFYEPLDLDPSLRYIVPRGCHAEVVYFRAGNLSESLLYLTLAANERAIRYFPVGPMANLHVPLAIVEPHDAGTELSVRFAAPRGVSGSIVLDVGLVAIRRDG